MVETANKTIIFSISHPYLFWTTGIYYVLELSKRYNIILVADESLKNDEDFVNACKLAKVGEVFYLPSITNPIRRHFVYSKKLKWLSYKHRPFMVLQHNHMYANNIYLFYWAKKANPECLRGVYLNAQLRKTDADIIFEELRNGYIESFISGFTKIKKFLKYFARSLSWAKKIWDYYILPKIFTGNKFLLLKYLQKTKILVPPKEYNYPSVQLVDFYLTYYALEKKICEEQMPEIKTFQISHPVETCYHECYEILSRLKGYPLKEENIVLILPSTICFDTSGLSQKNLSYWTDAIKFLMLKFSGYKFFLKLHPRTQENLISEITNKIRANFPTVGILEPQESAEKWILQSSVIVGDVSTTLWWANFFHSKIVISFDMHDFTGSDDMKYYDGILYFSSLAEFSLFEPSKIMAEQKKAYIQTRRKLPALNEVIERYNNIYEKVC